MAVIAKISTEPLCVTQALDFVDAAQNGAACLFAGRVRNHNLNRAVSGVTYDVYDALATEEMLRICAEVHQTCGADIDLYMAHFKGYLPIGGISVIIASGSAHREAAYRANRLMIEALKVRVPVWKSEHYVDGHTDWLEGHPLQS